MKLGGFKGLRKRIVVGMLVIALAAALLGGASYAWFTGGDNVNGTIKTGTLAITAETVGGVDFSFEDLAPGGETDVWAVELVNDGSLDLYYRAKVTGEWEANEEELAAGMIFVRWSDDESNIESEDYQAIDGSWFVEAETLTDVDSSVTYYFQFMLDKDADNDYQDQTFTATVEVEATQVDNQDDPISWAE